MLSGKYREIEDMGYIDGDRPSAFFVLPVVESPVDIVDQVFGCDGFDIFYDFGVTADL